MPILRRLVKPVTGLAVVGGGLYAWQWREFSNFFEELHPSDKPRLVVLGTGWGAMSLLQQIDCEKYNVSVVSPTNYFVFTPFLPCTTVGTIDFSHCIEPVRRVLFRFRKRAKYFEAPATDIDFQNNVVTCVDPNKPADDPSRTFQLPYEHLVIAVGADNNTFNTKGVPENTHFLKSLPDAKRIRAKILQNFEEAALPSTGEEEKKRLLHFVIVGGGPTGVEFAAELHDYVHDDLSKYFNRECKKYLRITIVEGMDRVLNAFDKEIAKYAEDKFRRNGVDVVTKTFVTGVTPGSIEFLDARTKERAVHPQGLVVWATGVVTKPVVRQFIERLGKDQANARALAVDGHLTVKGCSNVYAIGDCSAIKCEKVEDLVEKVWKPENTTKGGITVEDFRAFVLDNKREHMQLEFMADHIEDHFAKADKDQNQLLSRDEFVQAMKEADCRITTLPPTAQVASQQGAYLAQRLNRLGDPSFRLLPFLYDHRGSFAYVGENEVVYNSETISLKGGAAFWGRNTAYLSKMFSWESKRNIAWDLFWSKWFGRDISHT
jgi:NADH dehydrogenase FAD-containing subunit